MKREIKESPAAVELLDFVDIGNDLKQWLQDHAVHRGFKWLLAHAYDGVIWGRLDDGKLITSHQVDPKNGQISPLLREETLLQARLFAPHGELLLWRDSDNCWRARVIRDASDEKEVKWREAIDESQILWGTDTQPLDHAFTLMSDGSRGLRHIVPLAVTGNSKGSRPLRLIVRHYIQEDGLSENEGSFADRVGGFTRIVASRLLDLKRGEDYE